MTKVSTLKQEGRFSYGIKVQNDGNRRQWHDFVIPVIDVRDGEDARYQATQIQKAANQSRFMKPSFSVIGNSYQVSHKK